MTTKEEIINYVMNTPANTNRAVLESLLDGLDEEPTSDLQFPAFSFTLPESQRTPLRFDNSGGGGGGSFTIFSLIPHNALLYEDRGAYQATGLQLETSYPTDGNIVAACDHYIPLYIEYDVNSFIFALTITTSDNYIVTANNQNVAYDAVSESYMIQLVLDSAQTPVIITVADK